MHLTFVQAICKDYLVKYVKTLKNAVLCTLNSNLVPFNLSYLLILHGLQLPGIHAEPSCCDTLYSECTRLHLVLPYSYVAAADKQREGEHVINWLCLFFVSRE